MYLAVLQAAIISSAATFLSGTRLAVRRSRGVLQGAVISNDAGTQEGPRSLRQHTVSQLHIMMTAVIVTRAQIITVLKDHFIWEGLQEL